MRRHRMGAAGDVTIAGPCRNKPTAKIVVVNYKFMVDHKELA